MHEQRYAKKSHTPTAKRHFFSRSLNKMAINHTKKKNIQLVNFQTMRETNANTRTKKKPNQIEIEKSPEIDRKRINNSRVTVSRAARTIEK